MTIVSANRLPVRVVTPVTPSVPPTVVLPVIEAVPPTVAFDVIAFAIYFVWVLSIMPIPINAL